MPNKARKASPFAPAVKNGCPAAPSKANKKRKAKKDMNNSRSSPKAEEACVNTARKDVEPVRSPAGLPSSPHSPDAEEPCPNVTSEAVRAPIRSAQAPSNPSTPPAAKKPCSEAISSNEPTVKPHVLSLSHDAHPLAATAPETHKDKAPREESTPIHKRTRIITKTKGVSIGKAGGEFVSVQELQSEPLTDLVECGHVKTDDGSAPTTAFIGLKRKALQYTVVFTISCEGSERTIATECMDHYARQEYYPIAQLLFPLLLPVFEEADNNLVSEHNFKAFLQASETYLRLVLDTATGRLEPYPEFAPSQRMDWDLFINEITPTCPLWNLSDVKRLHLHSHSNMIYEVDLGDNLNSVVFKRVDSYGRFLKEYQALLRCGQVGIRAPRVLGLLGVGTHWGGFIMTKISASFCLEDRISVSARTTSIQSSLADSQRWFEQISNAVHDLHRDGYIWGDVKPANVLIDEDDNACLIDFEGGCSLGWVDEELADTEEGDLQGLDKVRDSLKLDE